MKSARSIRFNRAADALITYIVLIAVAAFFFFPCLWLILASFSGSGSLYTLKGFFPASFSLNNYVNLFTDTEMYNYPRWFANTLLVAVMSCIFGTFLTILTAYCMSRFKFKSRKSLIKTTLVLGMFPSFMAMTAVFLLMTQFNFINNHWGLILIYSAQAPMGYLVQKGFSIPFPPPSTRRRGWTAHPTFRCFCASSSRFPSPSSSIRLSLPSRGRGAISSCRNCCSRPWINGRSPSG